MRGAGVDGNGRRGRGAVPAVPAGRGGGAAHRAARRRAGACSCRERIAAAVPQWSCAGCRAMHMHIISMQIHIVPSSFAPLCALSLS